MSSTGSGEGGGGRGSIENEQPQDIQIGGYSNGVVGGVHSQGEGLGCEIHELRGLQLHRLQRRGCGLSLHQAGASTVHLFAQEPELLLAPPTLCFPFVRLTLGLKCAQTLQAEIYIWQLESDKSVKEGRKGCLVADLFAGCCCGRHSSPVQLWPEYFQNRAAHHSRDFYW